MIFDLSRTNILMLLPMIIYGDTSIHHIAQKLSFCPLWPSISYIMKCSLFITPNEFVNIQSTFITQNVKKGSADLELASEGITNVTEYCKLLPVALFPKQQQCGMVFWACPCSCRVHLVRWVNTITILEPKEISRESRKTWSS